MFSPVPPGAPHLLNELVLSKTSLKVCHGEGRAVGGGQGGEEEGQEDHDLLHGGRGTDREKGQIGQHLAGVGGPHLATKD